MLHFENRSFHQDRPRHLVQNSRGHVIVFFENRPFHEDRPRHFVQNILTSPPSARSAKNVCTLQNSFLTSKIVILRHIAPLCCCRKTFVFQHRPPRGDAKKMLPCERIFLVRKWPIFSTSPSRGDAKKCYHVNVFSPLGNCQSSQHRPQEVMTTQVATI